jgi:DNA polymerase-3 subunit delta
VSPAARASTAKAPVSKPSGAKASVGAWLLLGPEAGEKSAFIDGLSKSLAKSVGEPPELHRFYAFEAKMAEVVRCLRNQSLFARHRLVIVDESDRVKRAEEVAALVEYLKHPAVDATLVLVSAENPREMDRKIVAAIAKDNQKIFWEMFDNQKKGWVINFFKQKQITVAPAAVDHLLDMVENNTRDMRAECDRLALFFGPGSTIDLESVERYIYHSKEENVFTLFESVCARDLGQAEEILEKILLSRDAEATQLVSGLLWQVRNLARLKRLIADNYEMSEACSKLRITSKKNQKTYQDGSRNYSADDLTAVILCLAAFEERLRSTKADLHPLLLRLAIYYIVQRAGQGAWRQ